MSVDPGIRLGLGTDRHRFVSGRPLILGGVTIPHDQGLDGHSDADALLHAVTDACLGALALGDIGSHFPDTDPNYAGADSAKLLKAALELVHDKGFAPVNVDCVITTQAPKIGPHREALQSSLANLLELPVDRVSIKAKTAERLGPVGSGDCLDVQVVALLARVT